MNAYIYTRYSSDMQTAASTEAQIRACMEYAETHKITVVRVYSDEARSGKGSETAKRLKYQALMRDIKKGEADLILIHKYDRIARNLGEHVNLEGKLSASGIRLIAVGQEIGDTKEAKIVKTLLWSLSEYYIDNLSDEVRKGMREVALAAHHAGGVPPFGYIVVDKKYVINEREAAYVRRIFEAALTGSGYSAIVDELKALGICGKRGAPIRYPQIYEILRNEKYTGVYTYSLKEEKTRSDRRSKPNAIRIEGGIPEIIPKAIFEEVQKIMDERKNAGRTNQYDHLCKGLVYCSCGARMHISRATRKGHTYTRYICSAHCGAPTIREEQVDETALSYLKSLLSDANQQEVALALRRYQDGEKGRVYIFNEDIKRTIKEKQTQYDNYMEQIGRGALPLPVLEDIGKKMVDLKSEIENLKTIQPPPRDFTADQVFQWLESIKKAPDQQGVKLLIERIDIKAVKPTTEISIKSTLSSVVGIHGCGGGI